MNYFTSLCFAFVSVLSASVIAEEIPSDLTQDVTAAEADGLALFSAISNRSDDAKQTEKERELMSVVKQSLCDGQYTTVTIVDEGSGTESIYFLLIPPKEVGVQFGRHFRAKFKIGENDILSASASTKGCLLVPSSSAPDGSKSVAASVTHLLTPTPTEFHVFLSLFHSKPIYVSTSVGTWKVDSGKISIVNVRKS